MVKPDSTPFRCQGSGPSGDGSRASPPAPEPGPTASDPDARTTRTMTASGRQCRTANRRVESPSRRPADPAHLNGPPALGLPASRARPPLRPVPTQPICTRRTTAKQARGAHLATLTRRNRCRAYLRRQAPPSSEVPSQTRDTSHTRERTLRVSTYARWKTPPVNTRGRLSRFACPAPIRVWQRMPPPIHLMARGETLSRTPQGVEDIRPTE